MQDACPLLPFGGLYALAAAHKRDVKPLDYVPIMVSAVPPPPNRPILLIIARQYEASL